jgi:hypothetical protein
MSKDKDEKKNKAVNKAKIEYTDPKYRNILIRDDIITTTDQRTGKRGSHSISRNSIYSILKGDIDLSKENCSLRGGIGNTLEVTVSISKESSITLLFSKYSNGNIKNLEGWTIRESNGNEICLRFVKGKFFVNDKTKIPDGIF